MRNEAETGSLALRLMHSTFEASTFEIAPKRRSIVYMGNEQVPWQLPFKLLGQKGLS
jgi:hypothetical protein